MPRQMPRKGRSARRYSLNVSVKPCCARASIAQPKAPTWSTERPMTRRSRRKETSPCVPPGRSAPLLWRCPLQSGPSSECTRTP
eukprot:11266869-Prorocentrum_lima.AAC.1